MKIKVTITGTPDTTEIVNMETGEHLEAHCTGIDIKIHPGDAQATLTMLADYVEFSGEMEAQRNKT